MTRGIGTLVRGRWRNDKMEGAGTVVCCAQLVWEQVPFQLCNTKTFHFYISSSSSLRFITHTFHSLRLLFIGISSHLFIFFYAFQSQYLQRTKYNIQNYVFLIIHKHLVHVLYCLKLLPNAILTY